MTSQKTASHRVAAAVAGAVGRHRTELAQAPLLVAVSGGPDSMALLLGLMAMDETERPPLQVVHFSHGLRPRSEIHEEALVEAAAAQYGLPFIHGRAAPAQLRRSPGGSVEAAARRARYAFISEAAEGTGARVVALGHTLDDQAETVLLRLTRGTGLHGMGAMREWTVRADAEERVALLLFRPLLTVGRRETEAVCAEAGIVPAQDRSNRSLVFARNRVRHRVLKDMERLNPDVKSALARYALSAQEDERFLRSLACSAVEGHAKRDGDAATWPRAVLEALPRPLLIRVFQMAWESVCGPGAALSTAHLTAMTRLLCGPAGRQAVLPRGMTFSVTYRSVRLGSVRTGGRLPADEILVPVPGACQVGPWRVEVREKEEDRGDGSSQPVPRAPYHVFLDADAVGAPVVVRGRRPGDRFQPWGMPGFKRLQDFYVDAKVPRGERDGVPLLVAPGGIAWVVGYRVAAWAAVTPATHRVLEITARLEGGWPAPD